LLLGKSIQFFTINSALLSSYIMVMKTMEDRKRSIQISCSLKKERKEKEIEKRAINCVHD